MIQPRQGLRLPREALAGLRVREQGLAQDLDGDRAAQLPVAGPVDDGHRALPQHPEELVAGEAGRGFRGVERRLQLVELRPRQPAAREEPLAQVAPVGERLLQLGRRDPLRGERAVAQPAPAQAGDGGSDAVEEVFHRFK